MLKNICDAYWINSGGDIFCVKTTHIDFVRDNLGLFGITETYYRDLYDKYGEKCGFEGFARCEILTDILKYGWIRIRNYFNNGWNIELWDYNEHTKQNISNWLEKTKQPSVDFSKINIHILKLKHDGFSDDIWNLKLNI